jgi:SAM-dependent methyltransferase
VLAPERFRGYPSRVRLFADALPLDASLIAAEFGCGPAFIAEALAPKVRRLVGFEIGQKTVAALGELPLPSNLDIVAMDLCRTDLLAGFGGAFDLVYSADTLEHVADPAAFFASLATALKRGATAVVLFPNEPEAARHGVTTFATGAELLDAVGAGLELVRASSLVRSGWAEWLQEWGWRRPLRAAKRRAGLAPASGSPQTFDETVAGLYGFESRRAFTLANAWGRLLVRLSGRRAGWRFEPLQLRPDTPLVGKYVWLELERR